jgi:membrane protein DedA with SNARE-associated domain
MSIEVLFVKYGLIAIFLGVAIEGETAALIGGVVAHRGLVSPIDAALAAGAGSFSADQALFWLGRRYQHHPRLAWVQGSVGFIKAKRWMDRYPIAFTFGFRFIYGIRTASPIALGMSAISGRMFVIVNFLSALVWAALLTALGFVFGATIEGLFGRFQRIEFILLAILAGAVLVWAGRTLVSKRAIEKAGNGAE